MHTTNSASGRDPHVTRLELQGLRRECENLLNIARSLEDKSGNDAAFLQDREFAELKTKFREAHHSIGSLVITF
jgi:hypothetical protein